MRLLAFGIIGKTIGPIGRNCGIVWKRVPREDAEVYNSEWFGAFGRAKNRQVPGRREVGTQVLTIARVRCYAESIKTAEETLLGSAKCMIVR